MTTTDARIDQLLANSALGTADLAPAELAQLRTQVEQITFPVAPGSMSARIHRAGYTGLSDAFTAANLSPYDPALPNNTSGRAPAPLWPRPGNIASLSPEVFNDAKLSPYGSVLPPRPGYTGLTDSSRHGLTVPMALPYVPVPANTQRGPTEDELARVTTAMPSEPVAVPSFLKPPASLLIHRTVPNAKLPVRSSTGAAGYDLASVVDVVVPARGKCLVSTGLQILLPAGTYGRIAPRSGLAWKHHIDVGAGVIDADYRGIVKVVLFNHSEEDFAVTSGDRVAQLIIEQIMTPNVEEVQNAADLDLTARGSGGFGSTGC